MHPASKSNTYFKDDKNNISQIKDDKGKMRADS